MATGRSTHTSHLDSTLAWSPDVTALASLLPTRLRASRPTHPVSGVSGHPVLHHSAKRGEAPLHHPSALFGGGPSSPSRAALTHGVHIVSHARSFTTKQSASTCRPTRLPQKVRSSSRRSTDRTRASYVPCMSCFATAASMQMRNPRCSCPVYVSTTRHR